MGKKILQLIGLLLFLGVIAGGIAYFMYNKILNTSIGSDSSKKVFTIEKGLTGDLVLNKLESEEVTTSLMTKVLMVYIRQINPKFQEGTYKIPLNISPKEIVEVLQHPELMDIWVTIPEGLRKDEIATLIENEFKGITGKAYDKEEFLRLTTDIDYIKTLELGVETKDLEGFLFPDKYLLPAQATTDYIIRTLVGTFATKAGDVSYKHLIIASMLEREGLNDTDRPMISHVISKRLNEGWLLQIDATLLYYYKDWKHEITQADKKKNQPYNTYVKPGLPPTPICNPGLSSINAAKSPKANNYYYYIHANNGNVYFATTLAEHEANIAKYLR